MKRLALIAVVALCGAGPAPVLSGKLASPGVVWVSDRAALAPVTGAVITQTAREFSPFFAVVPAGSDVRFRNEDDLDHSVYSVSPADPFDLGIYEPGPGKSLVFANAGVVEIRCHIHRHMHATLIVVDGPYARVEAAGGRWQLGNLRPGTYALHRWTAETGETTESVEVR